MASNQSYIFPQLDDSNFSAWKFRVAALLEDKGVKWVIEPRKKSPQKMTEIEKNEESIADTKAKAIIIQCVTDRHIEYIRDAKTARCMLEALSKIFERKSTISKLLVRKKLITLKCTTSLQEHFVKFDTLIRELEGMGSKLEQDDKVCHLLLTMPEKYSNVITVLETIDADITLDFVKSRLLDAELKMNAENENKTTDEVAFNTEQRKCYNCGDTRHFIADCPKRNQQTRGNRGRGMFRSSYRGGRYNRSRRGNYARGSHFCSTGEEKQQEVTFIADMVTDVEDVLYASGEGNSIKFILDSGCTDHLVKDTVMKNMSKVEDLDHTVEIRVANNEKLEAKQKGMLKLFKDNVVINIEALIVPNLSFNLLSVRKISNLGNRVIFSENKAEIVTCKGLIIQSSIIGKMYIAEFMFNKNETCCVVEVNDLWHKRLGHLNRYSLKKMNLPVSNTICEPCKEGKANRLSFRSKELPRSHRIGELLHTDIGGPVQPTRNGERYYQVIIDDYSHFTQVFLLKRKSEAEENLMNYVTRLEAQFGRKCTSRIRCDNGGEFTSEKFKKFALANGIKMEYTIPYSPQMNGVSERLNRTLMDKVRTMFSETKLPKYLWGEAIRTAAYQLNRSPTDALFGDIPARVYYGKLDLSKLRIFGAKAWAVTLPRTSKLEPKARPMRMVGYNGNGYRLWDPVEDRIVVSRDVAFDESNIVYRENEEHKKKTEQVIEENKYSTEKYVYKEEETEGDRRKPEETNKGENTERLRKLPKRYEDYELYVAYCLFSEQIPNSYEEAVKLGKEWQDAIKKELDAHNKFETWVPATLPNKSKAIETKWVFNIKADGTKKARLVAKGYQQNIDEMVYSPVAKIPTIRLALSCVIQHNWEYVQLDVPNAFLNGNLDKEVYIKKPEGVREEGSVLKLKKALYGLREAPRCWNQRFNEFALSQSLKRSEYDVCLYVGDNVWLLLWVDDILLFGEKKRIEELACKLKKEFSAKDVGYLNCFLGTEIVRDKETIKISQHKLIEKILDKFGMTNCKEATNPMEAKFEYDPNEPIIEIPYRELVGSLIYLAQISRPDITYATSYLSRFLDKPTQALWTAGKRVLRYLKKTKELSLVYRKDDPGNNMKLMCYTDADWASDKTDRKSVSGMAIFHCKNLVSWCTKKQQTVALSSAEAEYISSSVCTTEALYLKGLLADFTQQETQCKLLVDNQGAIHMITNYENTKRSKHIDIKVNFIKDVFNKKLISVEYISSETNIADVFTKALNVSKFVFFRDKLCLI